MLTIIIAIVGLYLAVWCAKHPSKNNHDFWKNF